MCRPSGASRPSTACCVTMAACCEIALAQRDSSNKETRQDQKLCPFFVLCLKVMGLNAQEGSVTASYSLIAEITAPGDAMAPAAAHLDVNVDSAMLGGDCLQIAAGSGLVKLQGLALIHQHNVSQLYPHVILVEFHTRVAAGQERPGLSWGLAVYTGLLVLRNAAASLALVSFLLEERSAQRLCTRSVWRHDTTLR